ncbi:hypothetical protein QOZ80_3BG0260820 [Eleusine coracana subsp. coracana]|nr:hypothetical protein QOZ80_3BG0260820 [Eleusine coracana subsp. coracana]
MDGAAPGLAFELLPSSRGAMLLRFITIEDCEFAVTLSPVVHQGERLVLQHSADMSNRFWRLPRWLAYLSVRDYPLEHWFPANIRAALRGFGTVVEIDPHCLSGFDYSSLRLNIELNSPTDIPEDVWLMAPGGMGCVVSVTTVRLWPLSGQLDENGHMMPFFQYPPPPPPSLGGLPQLPEAPELLPPPPPPAPQGPEHPPASAPHTAPAASAAAVTSMRPTPLFIVYLTPIFAAAPSDFLALAGTEPAPCVVSDGSASPIAMAPPQPRARRSRVAPGAPTRHSARLANKEPTAFIDMETKASQLKALKNSLAVCSKELKEHVNRKGLLNKKKQPVPRADLLKLANAAGLGAAATLTLAAVPSGHDV